jgi:hypothetical protein
VNHAIAELVPLIANAPADTKTRNEWLARLFEAHEADQIPYIERLADHWAELCAAKEVPSAWADRLLDITRMALSPDKNVRGYFHGTTPCLAALYRAERYDEILDVLEHENFWPYKRWAMKALGAMGRKGEAIRLAEASRGTWTSDADMDALCEDRQSRWFPRVRTPMVGHRSFASCSQPFETFCNPDLHERLPGHSKARRFSIERIDHPNREVHVDPPLLESGPTCLLDLEVSRDILTLVELPIELTRLHLHTPEPRETFRREKDALEWLEPEVPALKGRRPIELIGDGRPEVLTGLLYALNSGSTT